MRTYRTLTISILSVLLLAGSAWAQEVQALQQQLAALQAQVPTLQAQVAQTQRAMGQVSALAACTQTSTSTDIIFNGCNVRILNGTGRTYTANGLGNLIIGYNENANPHLSISSG